MAKLIFTSRYMRDALPGQLQNYVRYVGTREGVEKIDESKKNLPVTMAQKKLIAQIPLISFSMLWIGMTWHRESRKRSRPLI